MGAPDVLGLVGQELASFRLTELVGSGATAVVFRGENVLDASIVRAIKVIRPELAQNPVFLSRFTEEARVLESLQHPNIVRFYGLRKEREWLVMELELVRGQSLAVKIAASSGLPVPEAVRVVREAAAGVAAAHGRGIVHRDLKPDNLLVGGDGAVKVLDFGIARALDDADRAGKLTHVGTTVGTPAYMAPEVCNGAVPSAAADVYALGLTLYEAIAGRHPFAPEGSPAKSTAQWMFAHVTSPVPPLHEGRPDVPRAISDVVARAIAKEPSARYADAAALAEALAATPTGVVHASTQFDVPVFSTEAAVPVSAPARGPVNRALLVAVAVGISGVAVGGIAVGFVLGHHARIEPTAEAEVPSAALARASDAAIAEAIADVAVPAAPPLAAAPDVDATAPLKTPGTAVVPDRAKGPPAGAPSKPSRSGTPTPPPPTTESDPALEGALNINSIPPSNVILDGKPLGATPRIGVRVTAGTHDVTFVNIDLGVKKTVRVTVAPGETKAALAKLQD